MTEFNKSIADTLSELSSDEAKGLKEQDVAARAEKYGKNKLEEGKKKSLIVAFFKALCDPMIIILIIAAAVSGVLAIIENESFADVIIIMAVVILNAVLSVFQESKAEKAIAALQEIAAATSKVIRDGRIRVIKAENLVPGDIVILEAGDSVPADGRLIECNSLKIEEAALTGESVPVTKTVNIIEGDKVPLGDRTNMAYMGSTAVYGRGKMVITRIGMQTEMGKIATALTDAKEEMTPLQKKLNALSKTLSFLVLGVCAVIFAVGLIRSYPNISLENSIDSFMVAVSLAVAAIPEGLAAVITIVLSIGVTKMSKCNAVIRKLTAVETLGCTQIICSDKTGTLTQNKMTVVEYIGELRPLCMAMALASDAEIEEGDAIGEPTECALVNFAFKAGFDKNVLKTENERIGEAPFDSIRKMMSAVYRCSDGIIQYTKGAPDEVLKKCTHILVNGEIIPLSEEEKQGILAENKRMADKALRVLGGAMRVWQETPQSYESAFIEEKLCFIGLTGMIDPVRPEVSDAIKECKEAGIRAIMITGDHRDTAVAIAKQLGIIEHAGQAVTGAMLDEMDDEEFARRIAEIGVYARVQPEHKVRIVNGWKAKGMITAMTGDGVNDAPSIKNADIGVGMGITGTDVTKNVADMVLTDDNFATIVAATEEGRKIYDNIRKSIQFLLASNLSEVIAIFVATILGFTLLKPVHLLWINLITDSFPALALGVEAAEKDVMKRPPRDSKEGIFSGGMMRDIIIQGTLVAGITILAYFIGHYMESGVFEIANSEDGMTMAFLTLSMLEIFHSFNMRSRKNSIFTLKPNKFIWLATVFSLVLTTAVIFVPFLSAAFGFTSISFVEYVIAMGLAATIVPIVEVMKIIARAVDKRKNK